MADETPKTQGVPADALAPLILGPLDYALAAGTRRALELGAPTHRVVEFLLNHLASVAAMVEPPQVKMTGYNRSSTEPMRVVIFYVSDPDTPFLDVAR